MALHLESLLIGIYLVLTVAAWLTSVVGFLKDLSSNGKTLRTSQQNWVFQEGLVPKRWFLHFYIAGLISDAILLIRNPLSVLRIGAFPVMVLQVARRCYECLHVHAWRSDSRMHISAYGLGILHYAILPLHIWISSASPQRTILQLLGVTICIYSQYEQHLHHSIVAGLRLSSSQPYVLPKGRLFCLISCPQYLTEIIIYIGFSMTLQTNASVALLAWVASNQMLSAIRTHVWYLEHFDGYKQLNRTALVPYLL